ncbi:MAG: hypothetical protein KAW00_05035, partial [Dehalococcoidia bacterium]|nr:hypothetical protein [Dehalococcoidia bacterium]
FFQLKVNTEWLTLSLSLSRYPLFKATSKIGSFSLLFRLVNIICIIGTYTEPNKIEFALF